MDHRKQALILDGATDLYTLICDTLGITRGDQRLAALDEATEVFVRQVLAIEDRRAAAPALRLVDNVGGIGG
jgi:hypothetical protein